MSLLYLLHLNKPLSSLDSSLAIVTPVGGLVFIERVYRECVVRVGDKELLIDLLPLDMRDFDVILGMDWLASYHVCLDCFEKEVVFQLPGEPEFKFIGERNVTPTCLISATKCYELLRKGCENYLAHVVDIRQEAGKLSNIPVVNEFAYVFP